MFKASKALNYPHNIHFYISLFTRHYVGLDIADIGYAGKSFRSSNFLVRSLKMTLKFIIHVNTNRSKMFNCHKNTFFRFEKINYRFEYFEMYMILCWSWYGL